MKAIVEGTTFPFTIPQGFRITPDFVIELVSPSDLTNQRYEDLQNKMTSDPQSLSAQSPTGATPQVRERMLPAL